MKTRVCITGMGTINPLGTNVEETWDGIRSGRSGVGPITRFDAGRLASRVAGEAPEFDLRSVFRNFKKARRLDLFVHFAGKAMQEAWADAGLAEAPPDADRTGVAIGSGFGGVSCLAENLAAFADPDGRGKVSAYMIPAMYGSMASGYLAIEYGLHGPNFGVVSACATGAHSVAVALQMIRAGQADVVIAGASEAPLLGAIVDGFCRLGALSTRYNDQPAIASRPFDRERDGFVIGEGAAVFVIESEQHATARGARIRAEVAGIGMSADASDMVLPLPDGRYVRAAMEACLRDAGLAPDQIDYVNPHATSTPAGDTAELRAIDELFGEHASRLSVSATKSMTGHLLGAAGALEMVITVLALEHGFVPPTINLDDPDGPAHIDCTPKVGKERPLRHALSNSFGFGGHNGCVALSRWS